VDESDAVKAALEARFARKLLEAGKIEQALALAKGAVARAPQAPEPHAVLADVLTARGDCAGAAKEQQLARAAQPKSAVLASATLRPCAAQ
jgi:Tfp pilus assembly protein PilF